MTTVSYRHATGGLRPRGSSPASGLTDGRLRSLFARITEVSTLPDVALRIVRLAQDPKSDLRTLADLVRQDPALAARILRLVNSSCYGLRNKVADLNHAVTLLGLSGTRRLAMTAYLAPLFRHSPGSGSYTRVGLWRHMLAAAAIAQRLAEISEAWPPQEAYLAGLLHDLGLILIDQYLHQPFCEVIAELSSNRSLVEIEDEVLGFNHAALGAYVSREWGFPEELSAAIGAHHAPEQCRSPVRPLVLILAAADILCRAAEIHALGVPLRQGAPGDVFSGLGFDKPKLADIAGQIGPIVQQVDATMQSLGECGSGEKQMPGLTD